jgi:hypothetical protein
MDYCTALACALVIAGNRGIGETGAHCEWVGRGCCCGCGCQTSGGAALGHSAVAVAVVVVVSPGCATHAGKPCATQATRRWKFQFSRHLPKADSGTARLAMSEHLPNAAGDTEHGSAGSYRCAPRLI